MFLKSKIIFMKKNILFSYIKVMSKSDCIFVGIKKIDNQSGKIKENREVRRKPRAKPKREKCSMEKKDRMIWAPRK